MRLEYKPENGNENKTNEADSEFDASKIMPGSSENFMDETRFQWKKMKEKPLREKLGYFFYYYKWHLIVTIAVIIGLASLIKAFTSHKDYAFYSMMVNSGYVNSTALSEAFAIYADIDLSSYDCYVDTSSTLSVNSVLGDSDISTSTKLAANIQAGTLDSLIMDTDNFEVYGLNGVFADLRDILTEDELLTYSDNIYYMDKAEIERYNDNDYETSIEPATAPTDEERAENIAYHQSPSEMTDPVPVGIIVKDAPFIEATGAYRQLTPVYGIIVNSSHIKESTSFLSYLFDESSVSDEVLTYGF